VRAPEAYGPEFSDCFSALSWTDALRDRLEDRAEWMKSAA